MMLRRVVMQRRADGRWDVEREHDGGNGERIVADDLMDANDFVLAAYRPDGTPRGVQRQSAEQGEGR